MPPSSAGDEPQLAAVPPSSVAGLAESGPVFDPSLALELLGLDADLFGQVLEASLRELEERLDAARLALNGADFALAARAAHTMKSTAAGIGAMVVRDRAVALERSARKDDIEEARVALQELVRAHQVMKAAVNRTHGAAGPSGREPTDKENAD
jgi:HPt (histidine-containing phosphotransfer) domain-containing protein